MGVSKNNGTPKYIYIYIYFNRVFHYNYKPSILGYPYVWKHPNEVSGFQKPLRNFPSPESFSIIFDSDFFEAVWAQKNCTSKTANHQKFHTKEFCNKHNMNSKMLQNRNHIIHIPFPIYNFASENTKLKQLDSKKVSTHLQRNSATQTANEKKREIPNKNSSNLT